MPKPRGFTLIELLVTVAIVAILCNVPRLGRIRDQRSFRRAQLRKTPLRRTKPTAAKRIVAAGIKDQKVEARARPVHLVEDKVDVDHLKIDISLSRRISAHWNQIVGAAHLDAVPAHVADQAGR